MRDHLTPVDQQGINLQESAQTHCCNSLPVAVRSGRPAAESTAPAPQTAVGRKVLTWLGDVPTFRPFPGLSGAHLQTILGPYLSAPRLPNTIKHRLELDDGDSLTVHENRPLIEANSNSPTIVFSVHGLAGCHRSSYVRRLAWQAIGRGWFSYRMDMRGAGDSGLQSRFLYHAGRSDDVLTALRSIRQRHPSGRIFLCGFSLGGAVTLHLLANLTAETRRWVDGAVVVCPPLDLAACAENIRHGFNRLYDRTFAKSLWRSLLNRKNAVRELGERMPDKRPRSLVDFDHMVTAPLGGYRSAADYYQLFSTVDQVKNIEVPTLVVFAKDDPLIPVRSAEPARWSPSARVITTDHGGHLGFIGTSQSGPRFRSVRWLENAIVHSIQDHLNRTGTQSAATPSPRKG